MFVVDRFFVGVVCHGLDGEYVSGVHDHLTFDEFNRGRGPILIADEIMNLHVGDNPHTFRVLDRLSRGRGRVEQIFNPFLRAERRTRVVFRILRFV